MEDLGPTILLSLILFSLGAIGVLVRRNLIFILMSIELMMNAANLLFVAGSSRFGAVDGQVAMLFVITAAACEAAVGLAMIVSIFRWYGTVETSRFRLLRG